MRKTIGIDLDDTLNCLVNSWLNKYNNTYNDNLQITNIKSWDICSYIKPECGKKMFSLLNEPNFFQTLDIQQNAYDVTKWLSQYFDLYIVTAYDYRVCEDKAKWVKNNLPHIDVKNIIFCNNKGLIKTDFLIDDKVDNLDDFKGTGICYAKPWNEYLLTRNNPDIKHHSRLNSWLDIQAYFETVLID